MGSLDLGGASTQIAFQVFDQPPGHKPSEKLFSQQYNLFARSYLCYGVNEARGRFLASLVDSTLEVSIIIFMIICSIIHVYDVHNMYDVHMWPYVYYHVEA